MKKFVLFSLNGAPLRHTFSGDMEKACEFLVGHKGTQAIYNTIRFCGRTGNSVVEYGTEEYKTYMEIYLASGAANRVNPTVGRKLKPNYPHIR